MKVDLLFLLFFISQLFQNSVVWVYIGFPFAKLLGYFCERKRKNFLSLRFIFERKK